MFHSSLRTLSRAQKARLGLSGAAWPNNQLWPSSQEGFGRGQVQSIGSDELRAKSSSPRPRMQQSSCWGQAKHLELHKQDISFLSPHGIKKSLMARSQAEPGRVQEAPEVPTWLLGGLCWVMFRTGSSCPLPYPGVGVSRCSSASLGQVTCGGTAWQLLWLWTCAGAVRRSCKDPWCVSRVGCPRPGREQEKV